jgi:hypothetical protein
MSTRLPAPDESGTLRCARHPNTETVLRCGRCETPICQRCMVMSPVGARCPACAQVKRFSLLLKPIDIGRAVAFGVGAGAIATAALSLVPILGTLLGPIFGLAIVGFIVGEAASYGANRKRTRELAVIAIVCLVVGYELGIVGLLLAGGARFSVALLLAPLRSLFGGLTIVGLLVGALLAWMRTR